MRRKLTNRTSPIQQPNDLLSDTAILLQRVGVVEIDEMALDKAVHNMKADYLVIHAATLYMNRKQQGLITFGQLLATLEREAA